MHLRWMCVLALCLGTSSAGFAGEQSGGKGASDAEIEAARRCLKPDTTRTAKAPSRPLALGTYGW